MKIVFSICFMLHYFTKVSSFEQLIKPGITVSTSSSVGWGGFPNKTVDGNYSQNNYKFCMHTAGRRREEWLKIDLGNVYNLKSVNIWYRGDKRNESENTKRLKGFSIRLSKSPELNLSEICYQDSGNESLPVMITRSCKGVARYVWFYTDKDNGGGVFLEICEVDVYGCPEKRYGENCSKCSRCKDTCDIITGKCGCIKPGYKLPNCKNKCKNGRYGANCKYRCRNCVEKACDHVTGVCKKGCKGGWKDFKCDQPCNKGFYGKNCSNSCGRCANKTACNFKNGNCPSGKCEPGWTHREEQKERKCNEECKNGTYGFKCKDKCSGHCARGLPCRKTDGICFEGCAAGWESARCNKTCNHGFYGQGCNISCGNCAKNKTCNNVNGSCLSGYCAPGYKYTPDKKCNQECDNERFGNNCQETCSGHCKGGLSCNKTDGFCPGGCADGWINPHCNETCSHGFYGWECRFRCGKCAKNANCNHVNGFCPSEDCMPGFKQTDDHRCDIECDNGAFGNNCEKKCSGHCAGGLSCNKTDGVCPGGCQVGWISPNCNETCKKGFYGTNCSLPCGSCALKETCDHVTGSCPSGLCQPGWKKTRDNRCDQECGNGTFGKHCMYSCSRHCVMRLLCNKVDGACSGGCSDGWTNDQCNETCGFGLYGKGCQEKCGNCGGPETCNHVSGFCPGQCEPGFQGEKCDIECEDGAFGFSCNNSCAKGCLSVCNKKIGTCDRCLSGYIGDFCNITVSETQAQDSTIPAAGVGVPITIIVFIVITALVVVLLRKARQKKAADLELPERKKLSTNDSQENETNGNVVTSGYGGNVEENALLGNFVTDNYSPTNTLIEITDFEKIIKIFSSEDNKKFNEEYKQIPYGEQQHIPCSVAKLQQNMPKNRYKTTFPYDHSRVVLNVSADNDYINANYIKDVEGKRRYIATQGPRKNTVQDFWEMIWQENIRVIVMVTNLIEGSKIKCEQYWPGQGEKMTSGQFCLQLMSQKDYANYTQRDINITNKKTNVVKTVNQVQFTAWPDHGTPSPIELLVFYRHVMRLTLMYPESLIVVHCSAGIGRTGTFIALDALYKHGQKEGKIDIVEYVKIMREDRMNMIQNADQYVFLYKALCEIFKTKGRLLSKEHFIKEVTSQLMSNKAANASQFKKEFNELLSVRPVLEEKDTKEARENLHLNMTQTVLPADDARVLLTSYVRGRGSYYNAVSISSYTLKGGIIAAQYPVEGAAVDLVRLLIDHECSILVSVNQLSDIVSSAEWMTTSAEKSVISPYKTMLGTSRSLSNKLKMTILKMKHDKDSEWHTVKVFEVLNWKGCEKLPVEEDVLVELMNTIQEFVKDPSTKITVLSRDGATGCGIFCAVYNAIQQLQQDNEVDMFTIVRQLQMRRPEMVSAMSEYQCCCKVVANFFSAYKDHIYENAQGQQEVTKMEENIYANTNS